MINFIKFSSKSVQGLKFGSINKHFNKLISNKNQGAIFKQNLNKYYFSRTELIKNLEIYLQKLSREQSLRSFDLKQNKDQNQRKKKQTQEMILKNFLQLTEESFCQHFLHQDSKNLDPSVLLMICSIIQTSQIIAKVLPKIYSYLHVFNKQELLLVFQLILAHKIKEKPSLPSSFSLQNVQNILVILSQLYPAEQLLEWIKQIPLYKGENVYTLALGFFSIVQKLESSIIYRNSKLLRKSYEMIKNLLLDQEEQLKVSLIILAFDSKITAPFGEQLILDLQINVESVDPFKLQLLLISLQKHVFATYNHIKPQKNPKKEKYEIIQEESQDIQSESMAQYREGVLQKSYQQLNEVEKLKKLQIFMKKLMKIIITFDWIQIVKLNMLIEYWKLFQTFEGRDIWNQFRSKIIKHTQDPKNFKSLMNLTNNQILIILSTLQKQKLNKPQLLKKLLIILSQRLSTIQKQNLIKLSRVLVTYVRQCETYLIQIRKIIEKRLFVFNKQEIQQLNQIYKRVQVLFPRPLVN